MSQHPSIVTVLTPAPSRRMATVDQVVAELGLPAGVDTTLVGRLIDRASGDIEDRCGRPMLRESVREVWRIFHGERLSLARAPLVSIDSIVEGGVELGPEAYELGSADPRVTRVWRLDGAYRRHWCGSPTVAIEYVAGYQAADEDPTDLPAKLAEACIALVRQRWFARKRDTSISEEIVEGVGRINYQAAPGGDGRFLPEIDELILPFVKLSAG